MDPHCTDICPLVSQEFVDAYHDLGRSARNVVFAAVNVNQYYNRVPDVLAYPRAHQLSSIPGWHFLTGPAAALRGVWRAYGVEVRAPSPDADIVHTSAVYFIGPGGTFTASLTDAAPAEGGLRSALVNTFHELGGAVGVAVLSSAAGAGLVMAHLGSHDFARAFAVEAVGAAVCLAIAAVLVPAVPRKPAG